MEDLKTKFAHLKEHVEDYTKTYADLAKLKVTKGASSAAAGVVIAITLLVFVLLFLIFSFIGLALWIATLVNSTALGFFIVAGFFLLLIIVVIVISKKVIVPFIRNTIISKVYDKN